MPESAGSFHRILCAKWDQNPQLQTVDQLQTPLSHRYRGAQDRVPTGGTIGRGIGVIEGAGIEGTDGGRGGGMSSALLQIGTWRQEPGPPLQSQVHWHLASAAPWTSTLTPIAAAYFSTATPSLTLVESTQSRQR